MASLAPGAVGSCRVAIVLVNYHGTIDTLKCLDSIKDMGAETCLTIVVDNDSTPDPSTEIAQAHPWARVIRCEENGGWAGGNNAGIRYALKHGVEWIVLLNNDTIVAPETIDRLLAAAQHSPDHGILGPIICFMDDPQTVMTDGCRFNRPGFPGFFERIPVPIALSDPPRVVSVDIVNGCCMMVSRKLFERIGLIDERFFLIHEESDFCLRAREAGFESGILAEPLVWHKGSSTFKRTGRSLQRYYDARNLFLLLWKHQARRQGRRTALPSWFQYLKYVYHRFSIEREQGEEQAADAVLFGFCDALTGRFGPQGSPRRLALAGFRWIFRIGHDLRGRRAKNRGQVDAVPVRQA
jgi:GT2 family glycosyltransferase